jgi:hypothetical protein
LPAPIRAFIMIPPREGNSDETEESI